METNESNPKPQPTGGLNILTIFIAVLALHVLVIGGITVYHLMNGGSTDADLVTDKTHKAVKVASEGDTAGDGQLPDGTDPDKSATASTTPAPAADTNSNTEITVPATAPAADSVTETDSTAPTETSSPVAATTSPTPAAQATASTPSGSTSSSTSAPAPLAPGPVITPPPAPVSAPEVAADPASTPATEPAAAAPVDGTAYVVKSRDSLAKIAHQHRITVAKLKAANGLKSDFLRIGQKLTIPLRSEPSPTSLAALREPNEPLLGDTTTTAPRAKPVESLPHDQATITRSTTNSRHTYTVVKGDTLIRIAHKFHTTPSAIMAANGSVDARKLRIGQKLKIPSQEARSANTTPAPAPASDQSDRTSGNPKRAASELYSVTRKSIMPESVKTTLHVLMAFVIWTSVLMLGGLVALALWQVLVAGGLTAYHLMRS